MAKPSLVPGIFLACAAAGPLTLLFWLVGSIVANPSNQMSADEIGSGGDFFLIWLLGAIFAAVPITLGAFIMRGLSDAHEPSRRPIAWVGAGALVGAVFGLPSVLDEPVGVFALAAASACCALICRVTLSWD